MAALFDPWSALHPDPPPHDDEELDEIEPEKEEEETVPPGTEYKESEEQDLDDLVHQQATEDKDRIPPPEEA